MDFEIDNDSYNSLSSFNDSSPGSEKENTSPDDMLNPNSDGRCMVPPFEIKTFTPNETNIRVSVVNTVNIGLGFIGCIPVNDLNNLLDTQYYLEEIYRDNTVFYNPVVNEYCLAMHEDKWYRARVYENHIIDRYKVVFIDYTNDKSVGCHEIRRYPMDLKTPCSSCCCLIHDLKNYPKTLPFQKFLKGKLCYSPELMIDRVLSVVQDCALVTCSKISTYMENFEEWTEQQRHQIRLPPN